MQCKVNYSKVLPGTGLRSIFRHDLGSWQPDYFVTKHHEPTNHAYDVRPAPRTIASGLLGADVFQLRFATAALRFVPHLFIATTATAVYYAASRKLRALAAMENVNERHA